MTRRAIVGYDGTAPSQAALAWAINCGNPVVVVHVVDADSGLIGDDYRREVQQAGTKILERVLDDVAARHPDVDVEGVLLEGPVAWALAEFAGPEDVLVIGTHKTGFVRGRLLGSRSIEVAMLADCDVMVVPSLDMRFRSGVVAGVADEVGLRDVVESAARVARERGEELLLLHGTDERSPENERAVVAEAISIARETADGILIRTRASNRHTAELLLDAARDRALLVLGSGSGDRTRSPIGSVLHDVLLNLTAPVLVTHATAEIPAVHGSQRVA